MTISAALSSALTGLGATSRSLQVVSSNISNALTPGYARRELDLGSAATGGVRVLGVNRVVDPGLLTERRRIDAELGGAETRTGAMRSLADTIGAANGAGSISSRVAQFEASLTEAASAPDSEARLTAVALGAKELTLAFNGASDAIQGERLKADTSIAQQVGQLNSALEEIARLNEDIVPAQARGQDTSGLLDRRQQVLDTISGIVPLRELPRQNGAITLMTENGQLLLDPKPVEIAFTPMPAVTPGMTLGAPLSGLTVGGRPIDMSSANGRMSGGTLSAQFDVRDRIAPAAQTELDALARDLVERVSAAGVDPSATGRPGLFTDRGAVFDAANETGISARISINGAVDPDAGGEAWRIRDGLYAAGRGAEGDATRLRALGDALGAPRAGSANLPGGTLGFADRTGAVAANADARLFAAERTESFSSARSAELIDQELANGVDTDQEIQKLMLIEQAYAANARVIAAADAMLQKVMEI